jgi:phenylacetate-CoA ligase
MDRTVEAALRILPQARIVRETIISAIRDGALLERRFHSWCRGHQVGCDLLPPTGHAALLDKAALRDCPERYVGSGAGAGNLTVKYTSGTTGRPVPILYDAFTAIEQMVVAPRRIKALFAAPENMDMTLGPMVSLSVTESSSVKEEIWVDSWGGFVAQVIVDERDATTFGRLASIARQLLPDLVTIKPSLLVSLLENDECSQAFAATVGVIAVSGSDFGDGPKANAEKRLKIPVVEAYGLTEFGLVASECSARAGMHVDPDMLAEVFDSDTQSFIQFNGTAREGELVLSSTRNAANPFVRYRTGDFVTLSSDPCVCGRVTPRLMSVSGRHIENFRLANGQAVSPARFNALFHAQPIAEFQLIQPMHGIFELAVEPLPGTSVNECELEAHVRPLIGSDSTLRIVIGPIKRHGKFQRFRRQPM